MTVHPDFARAPLPEQGFNRRPLGDGRELISPRKDKWTWEPAERRYRSAIICPREGIISQGFPKFDNAGEGQQDTARLYGALAAGEPVWFTEKMDGSLCIRSVIDGQVVLRTRGTHDGGTEHGPAMRALAERLYPALLDPAVEPDHSLLFEFVSPSFQIVVPYADEDLILLGAVGHADGALADRDELGELAERLSVPLVATHELPTDPAQLLAAVSGFDDREGIVARCDSGQVLVKIKSASYLAAHALRFAFSPRRVVEFCAERAIRDEDAFVAALREAGFDWEVGEETRAPFRAYRDALTAADARFAELAAMAEAWADLPRREFAARATPLGQEAKILFMLLDGRGERARESLQADLVEAAVREQTGPRIALALAGAAEA